MIDHTHLTVTVEKHVNDQENINCVASGDPTNAKTVRLSSLVGHAHQACARFVHSTMKLGHHDSTRPASRNVSCRSVNKVKFNKITTRMA